MKYFIVPFLFIISACVPIITDYETCDMPDCAPPIIIEVENAIE